jgi:3-oxoacyl-[acyl-carrier protein] reductase
MDLHEPHDEEHPVTAHWPADLLTDDVAVVTGAGRGIGLVIARELAAAGAHVAMFEREPDRLAEAVASVRTETESDRVDGFAVDITDVNAVNGAVGDARDRFGDISILVNNAGVTRDAYIRKMTLEQFDAVIDVHLRSAFVLMQACLDSMITNGSGAIVNMASSTGPFGNPGQANYAAAKAGIIGMTRTAAVELSRFAIRSNAIAPGAINTPMMQSIGEQRVQGFVDVIPLGRLGDPREVAHAAVFLASPLASYITGHVVFVDGGFTVR